MAELEANIEDAYSMMREEDNAPLRADSQLKELELEV
jgi:hypothetical protein